MAATIAHITHSAPQILPIDDFLHKLNSTSKVSDLVTHHSIWQSIRKLKINFIYGERLKMKAIDLKKVINSKLLFVSHKSTIRETVLLMRQEQKSSVLVFDDQDKVVGIVTERDIVQKFTPIDYELKSDMLINTLMTRPVKFVRLAFLYEDMNRLHLQHGLRHFPLKKKTNRQQKQM